MAYYVLSVWKSGGDKSLLSPTKLHPCLRRSGRITNGMRSGRTPHFHPQHRHPPPRSDLEEPGSGLTASALVSDVPAPTCKKWGMASSAACECGAEEQTVDHVVLQCPIHRPPHGLHGLTVLDDETIEWLLKTYPEIWCGRAVVWTTGSKEEDLARSRLGVQPADLYLGLLLTVRHFAPSWRYCPRDSLKKQAGIKRNE